MTIEEIYQSRRDRQAKLLELRRDAIEQEHPELAELIRQINLANVRIAKAQVFDNVDTQTSELERIELQAKKTGVYAGKRHRRKRAEASI